VDGGDADADDWEGLQAALNWQPDPVEVGLTQRSRERNSDIITMLVSVYGSKELFINEYR
jgi:anaphase-promoting complex subunit 2